jgi:hypothetical protein
MRPSSPELTTEIDSDASITTRIAGSIKGYLIRACLAILGTAGVRGRPRRQAPALRVWHVSATCASMYRQSQQDVIHPELVSSARFSTCGCIYDSYTKCHLLKPARETVRACAIHLPAVYVTGQAVCTP